MAFRLVVLATALSFVGCGADPDESGEAPGSGGSVGAGGGGAGGAGATGGACEGSLTDFDGDCFALPVPAATDGIQLHYGPSDYSAPADVDRFVLDPGDEVVDCLHMTTPNDEEVFFSEWEMTARFGTHHVIVWTADAGAPDGTLVECPTSGGPGSRWMLSMQSALDPAAKGGRLTVPEPGAPLPPENLELAWHFLPRTHVSYQVHFVNTTDRPILRESWLNVRLRSREGVAQVIESLDLLGGLGMYVQPRTHEVIRETSCDLPPDAPNEIRILGFTGHMHAHGQRFTAWKSSPTGERTKIYETFDWAEADVLRYDSVTNNPAPNPSAGRGGGSSGVLTLNRDERIEWECEIDNTTDAPLRWANEAYTAEMCNFLGFYTPGFGRPWACPGGP